mgnify:CR=1 FL=1
MSRRRRELFFLHSARAAGGRVRRQLPALPDDADAQPALPAAGLHQGDPDQLHDHPRGSPGPDARHPRRRGEARAGGEEEQADCRERQQQEAAERNRG